MSGTRFELDEAKAAEYLAGQVAQYTRYIVGEGEAPELEIGVTYDPVGAYADRHDTQSVVYYARANGLITGPGEIEWDADDEGDYLWIVYLPGPGSLKLSTYYSKIKHLGDGSTGADGALAVLRQAVREANGLLDDLDAYIASRTETGQ